MQGIHLDRSSHAGTGQETLLPCIGLDSMCSPKLPPSKVQVALSFFCPGGSPSRKEFLQLLIRIFCPWDSDLLLALLFCPFFYQFLLLCLGPKGHLQRPLHCPIIHAHKGGEEEVGEWMKSYWQQCSQSFRILRLPTLPSFKSLCTLSFVQLLHVNKTPNEIPSNKTAEVFKSCYKNLSFPVWTATNLTVKQDFGK